MPAEEEINCLEHSKSHSEASEGDLNPEKVAIRTKFSTTLQAFRYQAASPTSIANRPRPTNQAEPMVETPARTSARKVKSETDSPAPHQRKRKGVEDIIDTATKSPISSSKKRSTTKERSANDPYNPESKLVDSLRSGLMLVFVGLNPGLRTASTGHAYAHPTNMFWPLLHQSGVTPIRHKPEHTYSLMDLYSIGNTNLCVRATRAGDGLSKEEQMEGARVVEDKISDMKPEAVCIVGKGVWEFCYKMKTGKTLQKGTFSYGWQPEELWLGRKADDVGRVIWKGSKTFVSTSTSGLAADTKPAEKLAIMKELGDWVNNRRADVGQQNGSDEGVNSAKVEEGKRDF